MAAVPLTAEVGAVPSAHDARDRRSALPSVDRLLAHALAPALLHEHGHSTVVAALRVVLAEARAAVAAQAEAPAPPPAPPTSDDALIAIGAQRLTLAARPRLRPVFNLTGTVLHTNLGRALLPDEAIAAVTMAMRMPANLEFDLDSAGRGDRDDLVEGLVRELTGPRPARSSTTTRRRCFWCSTRWRNGAR